MSTPLSTCATQTHTQGFALFNAPAAARYAVDLVSGSQFDDNAALRAEMARKNMYLKVCARVLSRVLLKFEMKV